MHIHFPYFGLRSRHQHLTHQRLFSIAFQLPALQHGGFFSSVFSSMIPRRSSISISISNLLFSFFTPGHTQMRQRRKRHKQQEGWYSLRMREKPINSWRGFRRPAFVLHPKKNSTFSFVSIALPIQTKQFLAVSKKSRDQKWNSNFPPKTIP